MDELIPLGLGIAVGIAIVRMRENVTRIVVGAAAIVISGFAATCFSGEYLVSWVYLLLDAGEAAFGLAIGLAVSRWLLPARPSMRPVAENPARK
jgi:hypothetical protein